MNKRRRNRRQGFTLTEILLVMAILVMVASMAVVGILSAQKRASRGAALTEIESMKTACTQFRLELNKFPDKLDDLFVPPQGVSQAQWGGPYLDKGDVLDPWGNRYQYSQNMQTDTVIITSAGPDGQPGNEDDVPGPSSS